MTPLNDHHLRPVFHFTPPSNWLNDPNGLVYYHNEYHLFYQHNPHAAVWGPMFWGHATSHDLVCWDHVPIALSPDERGTIFSGSMVIDWDNTAGFGKEAMVAIFTHHQPGNERQSLAFSTDRGRHWQKYANNPVLSPPIPVSEFRDPKVFWYNHKGQSYWVMALAVNKAIHFYRSPNLLQWEYTGSFPDGEFSNDVVWETPDLFELAVDGANQTRWVLTVGVSTNGPGGKSGMKYFVGDFDGHAFTLDAQEKSGHWMDFGADFYAAQTWNEEPFGRRLCIGWQNNWQYAEVVPTTTWRGGFSFPRELSLHKTEQGIRLFQTPVRSMQSLRHNQRQIRHRRIVQVQDLLDNYQGGAYELLAVFAVKDSTTRFGFHVLASQSEKTVVGYDNHSRSVFVDRSGSGVVDFDDGFARCHHAPLDPENGFVTLHILVDHSSVEVFANQGRTVISDSVFPSQDSHGLFVFADGEGIELTSLDFFELTPSERSDDQ